MHYFYIRLKCTICTLDLWYILDVISTRLAIPTLTSTHIGGKRYRQSRVLPPCIVEGIEVLRLHTPNHMIASGYHYRHSAQTLTTTAVTSPLTQSHKL